jgi:carbamoyltransferase
MSAILGLNAFHADSADSAACLVVDGKLVGAVAEERLGTRESIPPAARSDPPERRDRR